MRAKKKLSNRLPETTTTQAIPSLSRARMCVAVRAWPYVQKNKQTKKKLSNRVPETTTTQAVPSLSRARTCVTVRANQKKTKKNFQTTTQAVPSLSLSLGHICSMARIWWPYAL